MGVPSPQKRISAAPPSSAKIGAPRTTAASRPTSPGITKCAGAAKGCSPIPAMHAVNSNAASRPPHRSDAFHSSRSAMTANPTGIINCTAQIGIR